MMNGKGNAMKGERTKAPAERLRDAGGISPQVVRVTDLRWPTHHVYFTQRSFTPDDKSLIVLCKKGEGFDLHRIDLESQEMVRLTEGRSFDYFPFPSWDGKSVIFGNGPSLWRVGLADQDEEELVNVSRLTGQTVTKVGGAYQSYDGARVVCFYEAKPDFGLVVYEMATRTARVIIHGGQPLRHCQFCPLDPHLLVYAHEGSWDTICDRMWLIKADGSENRKVRETPAGERVGHEFWANGSRTVYFTVYRGEASEIRVKNLDTGVESLVVALDNCHAAIHPRDKYLVADNNRGKADDMFLIDVATKKIEVLCYPRFSWKESRFHPHPTFSTKGDRVVFTSDVEGAAAVYVASLPEGR
jgi:Tol biopolymer transport system component